MAYFSENITLHVPTGNFWRLGIVFYSLKNIHFYIIQIIYWQEPYKSKNFHNLMYIYAFKNPTSIIFINS